MKTTLLRACRALVGCTATVLTLLAVPATAADTDAQETKALHALFDRHWDWSARTFPEFASYRGDHRFGDRL